jgi:hypothetical protein
MYGPPARMRGVWRDWSEPIADLAGGLGGWRLRGLHLVAGGLPPDVDSSLHVLPPSETDS